MNKIKNMNNNNKMLERVLLMMKYDSSKTLTENSDVVRYEFAQQLNEAVPKVVATPKIKTLTAKQLARQQAKQAKITQVATYASTPLPNGNLPTIAQQKAYAKSLSSGTVTPAMSTVGGQVTATVPQNYTVTMKPPKPSLPKNPANVTPKDQGIMRRLWGNIKRNPGKWTLGIVGAGLTATALYYLLRNVPTISKCLLDSLTEEELNSLQAQGTSGQITRTQVGNRIVDLNGGLSFGLDNGQVTTVNEKYKGTYSCDGNNIKVSIAGTEFIITGGSSADSGTKTNIQSKYKQCSETLPIPMYCKNSTIGKVQGCLNIKQDGAFGPLTSQALVAKGADGQSITQASIDKVCGGAEVTPEKLTKDVDITDISGNSTDYVGIKDSNKSNSEEGMG
jgi:hypothetical protein